MAKKSSNKKETRTSRKAPRKPIGKDDPWGCMAGTMTIQPGVDLTAPSSDVWGSEEEDQRGRKT
jgi:hypothetical protein